MSFKQYTKCVDPAQYTSMVWYLQVILKSGIIGAAAAILLVIAGAGWCALLAIPIAAAVALLSYCSWWLNDRLICLYGAAEDVYAIGAVINTEPPWKKVGFDVYDSDFSLGLLLANCAVGVTQLDAEKSSPYGWLLKEQPSIQDLKLIFTGQPAGDANSAILHCEFEGASVRDTADGAGVGLILAILGAIVCVAVPPPWGPILAGILALLAFLAMLLGSELGKRDYGYPTDVNQDLATIHQLTGASPGDLIDILAVSGTWVFDAGHQWDTKKGWNEIHPVKVCYKVASWDPSKAWPDLTAQIARGSAALATARSPAVVKAQQDPSNQWNIHPLIDGCESLGPPTAVG